MGDIMELEAIMDVMEARLDIDVNDREARAIFDRSAELLADLVHDEYAQAMTWSNWQHS